MKELTDRQQAILIFIETNIREKGCSPTVREIGDQVGVSSTSTVHKHLNNLIDKGYLRKEDGSPRTIRLVKATSPKEDIVKRMKELDDDITDIVMLEGQPFLVKRATDEDIQEWLGAEEEIQ